MPQTPHIERHFTAGESVRDVVIGMSDGLTVPFALAAGLSGARFPWLPKGARGLTGGPGHSPGAADMAWREWRWPGCQCPAGSR